MSNSTKTKIELIEVGKVNEIKVLNFDSKGNLINPKNIIIKEQLIYELIKKYIKI